MCDGIAASKSCREVGRSEFNITYLWRVAVVLSTENSTPTARGSSAAAPLEPTARTT
jgi:hypothetical protein